MKISWYGQSCFKIETKKAVIATDPFNKEIGLTPPRFKAEIVTVSHQHSDHNNVSSLKGNPFIIEGPGEYEFKDITVRGINSFHDQSQGKKRGLNTIFVIEVEDMRICHLGDFGQKELTNEQLEELSEVDILMIPVGGVYTINGEKAADVINQIEPKIVIPMHYKIPNLKVDLKKVDSFIKEMGTKKEGEQKLTIKKSDLLKEDMRLIVLEIGK